MRNHAPAAAGRPVRWQVTLIIALFFVAVAGAALAGWWYARESPPHQGPLVLISIDGLRADGLTAYGARQSDSPSIDALAADAVVFERAYTHSPLTLPAHASLLLGQLPFEHGVRDEIGFTLTDRARPLPELLRSRGFETGAAVSSFLLRPESGLGQGFTFFDAEVLQDAEAALAIEREGTQTVEAAERWIRRRRDERFFLFVHVTGRDGEPAVSRLVQQLRDRELYDRATILVTAGRSDATAGVSLGDSALRVPLLVKQPDGEGAGRRVTAPVQHIDILPTVLDLVRAPMPSGLRGRSLRAVLDSENGSITPQPIYAESLAPRFRFGGYGLFALTDGGYRLLRGSREEVIDLERDTVISVTPDDRKVAQLRETLDRLLEGRAPSPPAEISASDEDHYAALGYLGGSPVAAFEPEPVAPDDPGALIDALHAAAVRAGEKKYGEAIDQLRGIARAHPRLTVVQYQLGMLLARTGRLDEAGAAFRAAAALQPENPAVPLAHAHVLMRTRRYDEAQEQAARGVALAERRDARSRAAAHEMAARVALLRRETHAAEAHARAAQMADPTVPMEQYVRGRLLHEEANYEAALAVFEEAEAVLKQHGRALEDFYWYFGDTLARLDRYPKAEARFRDELRAFPRSVRAYSSLAMLYRASRRERGVEDVLDELLEAAPTPEGYATAARLWTIFGERDRAAALRADARVRFPGDPSLALLERTR